MGGAVSLQQRCRKALVIRAYNMRPSDQTLEEQFSSFSYLKGDGEFYTNADLIKQCLNIGENDYPWLEPLMQILSNTTSESQQSPSKPKIFEIRLGNFLSFLETGSLPIPTDTESSNKPPPGVKPRANGPETPPRRTQTTDVSSPSGSSTTSGKGKQFPPVAPVTLDAGGRQSSRTKLVEVIDIDLSNGKSLPEGIKLKSSNQENDDDRELTKAGEDTLEIIVRSAPNAKLASNFPGAPKVVDTNGKQLWRKREVTRQERTVHYTTVDEAGEMQELVEKETTQTEILHMECRDTGEFAHKELTEYEQIETFNEELVNEVRGHEEYVHLKSLEDEFHYMDSTMPPKADGTGPGKERSPQEGDPAERESQDKDAEHTGYAGSDAGGLSPPRKGASNASYLFEPADAKDVSRGYDADDPHRQWSEEEEAAYHQYCSEFKQGDFQFPISSPQHEEFAEASAPIVTHIDETGEEVDEVVITVPDPENAVPPLTSADSYNTGGLAIGSITDDHLLTSPDGKPATYQYSSMHDID